MRLSSLGIIVLCCATGLFVAACARTRTKPEIKTQYYIQKMRQAVSDAVTDHNRKDQLLERVDQMEERIFDLNFEAKALVTEDGWYQVLKFEEKAIKEMLKPREQEE
jgi:hypothetical protein